MSIGAEPLIGALLALLGIITVALIGGGVSLVIQIMRTQNDNQLLWHYNRQLVDHIYRGNPPPPPAPPAGLFD